MKRNYVVGAVLGVIVILLAGLSWMLGPTRSPAPNTPVAVATVNGPGHVVSDDEGVTASAAIGSKSAPAGPASSGNAVATGGSTPGSAKPRPVSLIGGQAVDYPGSFAAASVQVGQANYKLTPNQLGNFQQVVVGPKQKVQVQVSYPDGSAGDKVAVTVEDGGHLNEKQMSEVASLDADHNVNFQFQTTDQAGIYRVALRGGADVKVLNFWVGQ